MSLNAEVDHFVFEIVNGIFIFHINRIQYLYQNFLDVKEKMEKLLNIPNA